MGYFLRKVGVLIAIALYSGAAESAIILVENGRFVENYDENIQKVSVNSEVALEVEPGR